MRKLIYGLDDALALTLDNLRPLEPETVELSQAVDRVPVSDVYSLVDSPSVNASLKDGYAVLAHDVAKATKSQPVKLRVIGYRTAGRHDDLRVTPGHAMRISTGAGIPPGADAVVSEEFTTTDGKTVIVYNFAETGRNIMNRGDDVSAGQCIAGKGLPLTPGAVGLLTAGGHGHVSVVRNPIVAIMSTGDEVIAPGHPLTEGKIYASNMSTLCAWCRRYDMATRLMLVKDDADEIASGLESLLRDADAAITCGGAWISDRDLVARILKQSGWHLIFHRIRIGPGKAVGLAIRESKPVFILPGGPPSNLMAFLQIALPGLMRMTGHARPGLPVRMVRLTTDIAARGIDWTQFIFGILEDDADGLLFHSLKSRSRLESMAMAQGVVSIPEGRTHYPAGTLLRAQILGT